MRDWADVEPRCSRVLALIVAIVSWEIIARRLHWRSSGRLVTICCGDSGGEEVKRKVVDDVSEISCLVKAAFI